MIPLFKAIVIMVIIVISVVTPILVIATNCNPYIPYTGDNIEYRKIQHETTVPEYLFGGKYNCTWVPDKAPLGINEWLNS